MSANDRQVDGEHYDDPIQVWDFIAANQLDWFQGNVIKYVSRWKRKGGMKDLLKAQHVLEKYIEVNSTDDKKHN